MKRLKFFSHFLCSMVAVSPVWTIEPMDTSVLFEQSIVLNCQASGFPTPSVTWKKASGMV